MHQLIGVFAERDAVSAHTAALHDTPRARGVPAAVFAGELVGAAPVGVHPVEELDRFPPATTLVYQASSYSPMADLAARRPEPLVVNYHNVTPADYFRPWERSVAAELRLARRQVRQLARRAVLGLADTAYNAAELRAIGYRRCVVSPVLIDTPRLVGDGPSPWPPGAGTRWLFVGRIAPNKAQHDIVKAFALYRASFVPDAVLVLAGRSSSHAYSAALDGFIAELGLGGAVLRPGSVHDDELGAWYRHADVFVCLSDHEGFCNTVVEAMAADVPVVAYASSALPETIGSAGLLLYDKSPATLATAVHRIMTDVSVRHALVAHGRARAAELSFARASDAIADVVCGIVDAVARLEDER